MISAFYIPDLLTVGINFIYQMNTKINQLVSAHPRNISKSSGKNEKKVDKKDFSCYEHNA